MVHGWSSKRLRLRPCASIPSPRICASWGNACASAYRTFASQAAERPGHSRTKAATKMYLRALVMMLPQSALMTSWGRTGQSGLTTWKFTAAQR